MPCVFKTHGITGQALFSIREEITWRYDHTPIEILRLVVSICKQDNRISSKIAVMKLCALAQDLNLSLSISDYKVKLFCNNFTAKEVVDKIAAADSVTG
ncbi:MAG: hypothetical protein KJ919_09485 [Verrucomicrobia bacterium]|nr:hypothetical protein [Verrucomicrobiota bacterium]